MNYEYDIECDYDPSTEYDDEEAEDYVSEDESGCDGSDGHFGERIKTEIWSQLRINDVTVGVSSHGRIKDCSSLFNAASLGVPLPGTPYRVYKVGDVHFYVHDLVWRTFHGPILDGYVVRHHSHYVNKKPHRHYSNRIECLICEKNTVEKIPFL